MEPTTPAAALTHGCVRCGAPIPLEDAMCERCNPLGLKQPAASQVHGTVFVAVAVAVVGLALLASFAVSGIGPFTVRLLGVASDPPGLNVTVSVTNTGTRAGATACRVWDRQAGVGPETAVFQTPRIDAGATITINRRVTELGSEVRELIVECHDL